MHSTADLILTAPLFAKQDDWGRFFHCFIKRNSGSGTRLQTDQMRSGRA